MAENGWWKGAVIYQVYPRSFRDTNGDGIGDLPGITGKLDQIASLGVDAIWLSPYYPSPMKDFGYDVTEHCAVDPDYGTMEDIETLIEEAHARGLKVIIDAVLNHTSAEHPWFTESRQDNDNPKADWYQWRDAKPDGSPPNNWISRFAESQWTWCPVRQKYYRHQYMADQPALNLDNDEVIEKRVELMGKWLDRGVDGLRFDAVTQYYADPELKDNPPAGPSDDGATPIGRYSTFAFQLHENDCNHPRIEDFVRKLVDEVECQGCTFCFAEMDIQYKAFESLGRFTGEGLFGAGYVPQVMSAPPLPSAIAGIIEDAKTLCDPRRLVWTITNHDASRLVSRWEPEDASAENRRAISRLGAALFMCMEGQVSFFQGEELGLPDADYCYEELKDPQGLRFWPRGHGRDPIRHPFPWEDGDGAGFTTGKPWLPIKKELVALNAAAQQADGRSTLAHWRRMIALRKETPALRHGSAEVLKADDEAGLFGLARTHGDERVEAWFKFGGSAARLPRPEGEVLASSGEDPGAPYGFIVVRS